MEFKTNSASKQMTINIDTSEMTENQVRLFRQLISEVSNLIVTDDECEYFDSSAQAMSLILSAIKQAHFIQESSKKATIPYADQAIEFSMDSALSKVHKNIVVSFDN